MSYPGMFIDLNLFNISKLSKELSISRQTLYNVWNGINRPSVDLALHIWLILCSSFVLVDVAKNLESLYLIREQVSKINIFNIRSIWG